MDETAFGLKVAVPLEYETAVERTIAALKTAGFGVLTTIDVQQTLKQKLDRDFRKYVILGACNPPLADRALHAELEVGLLLPCNVIVYKLSPGRSAVSAMAPMAALGIVGENPALQAVARDHAEGDIPFRHGRRRAGAGAKEGDLAQEFPLPQNAEGSLLPAHTLLDRYPTGLDQERLAVGVVPFAKNGLARGKPTNLDLAQRAHWTTLIARVRVCPSAGFARATPGGRLRKGGEAPLRGSS